MSQSPAHDDAPACGLYRTTLPLDTRVEADRLVYYHNHGDPGPGIYPAEKWNHNRATFTERGYVIPDEDWARTMEPLPPEGLYHVDSVFFCCPKECQRYEPGDLVQLGYNGTGQAILFRPFWGDHGLELPDRGTLADTERLSHLSRLRLGSDPNQESPESDIKSKIDALIWAPLDYDQSE